MREELRSGTLKHPGVGLAQEDCCCCLSWVGRMEPKLQLMLLMPSKKFLTLVLQIILSLRKSSAFAAWQQLCLAWSVARAPADKMAPRGFAIRQPSGLFQGTVSEGPDFITM